MPILNREGFWKGDDLELPWPEESDTADWYRRDKFLAAMKSVEAQAVKNHYRGFSKCRLCGCTNGSSEFVHAGWLWPSGLRHYFEGHKVRPSLAFEEMILREGGQS